MSNPRFTFLLPEPIESLHRLYTYGNPDAKTLRKSATTA